VKRQRLFGKGLSLWLNYGIPKDKPLKSITLPQNQNVRILDIKMGN